jgi:hypothetical protein
MTPQDKEWLESEFQKINNGIEAILGKIGMVDADVRAFRDAMLKSKDHPNLSGDALFKEYADRFGEYCQTIDTDVEEAASHVRGLFDTDSRKQSERR